MKLIKTISLLVFFIPSIAKSQVMGTPYIVLTTFYANSITFSFTGDVQTWIVPTGVNSISVDMQGAQGGSVGSGVGGKGGRLKCILPVTPGQTLYLYIGGQPPSNTAVYGFAGAGGTGKANGQAGGGLAAVGESSTLSQATALAIVGGGGGSSYFYGGGSSYYYYDGGDAGGDTGSRGAYGNFSGQVEGGAGGTLSAGGANGTGYDMQSTAPSSGTALYGGNGGIVSGSDWNGGGGGGAGYYGGGGGAGGGSSIGAGGGGSSWAKSTATEVVKTAGFKTGDGLIIISY